MKLICMFADLSSKSETVTVIACLVLHCTSPKTMVLKIPKAKIKHALIHTSQNILQCSFIIIKRQV